MTPYIVMYAEDTTDKAFGELLLGVEEEGVPIQIKVLKLPSDTSKEALSQRAARESNLNIGVSYYNKTVIVYTKALIFYDPLFEATDAFRTVGKNVARYVKNKPFI